MSRTSLGRVRPLTEEEQAADAGAVCRLSQAEALEALKRSAELAEENSESPASKAAAASGSTAVAGFDENDPSPHGEIRRRNDLNAPAVRAKSSSIATASLRE